MEEPWVKRAREANHMTLRFVTSRDTIFIARFEQNSTTSSGRFVSHVHGGCLPRAVLCRWPETHNGANIHDCICHYVESQLYTLALTNVVKLKYTYYEMYCM